MNLVLPIINLSILDADILIIMQQLIFGWSSTGDHPETLLLFELFCFSFMLKSYWWVVVVVGDGLPDFTVSPRPHLGLIGF